MADLRSKDQSTEQDWNSLSDYLKKQGYELCLDPGPRQFSSGFGNLNYLLEIDGEPYVLRRPPLGPIPPGANDMGREYRILSRLHKAYPLAPKALLFCHEESVIGAPFFIMDYREGVVIGGDMPDQFKNWQSAEGKSIGAHISYELVKSLAAFHKVDPAAVDLDSLGKPDGFNARTLKGWLHRVDLAYDQNPPAIMKKLESWLQDNLPEDGAYSLIHNDFKLDNVILDKSSFCPVAVIDWDMGTRGSPIYDLCVMLSYWTEANDPSVMFDLHQMPTHDFGFMSRKEVVAVYQSLTGFDMSSFKFYRILAMLRLAGIFAQLNRRYREGGSTDERFASFDKLAEELMIFADQIINEQYY